MKTQKKCPCLKNGWEYSKILKILARDVTFRCSSRNDFCFKYYIKKKMFKTKRYFLLVKMNLGSKFGAWVSSHTAVLLSLNFKKIWGGQL